jgi:hypothetical protein
MVIEPNNQLLPLLETAIVEFTELIIANPETHGNRPQRTFRGQCPDLGGSLPRLARDCPETLLRTRWLLLLEGWDELLALLRRQLRLKAQCCFGDF